MSDWRATPTLVGRHVTLRPLDPADLDGIVAAARADDLWDLFYSSVSQLKQADRWLAAGLAEHEAGRARLFTVLDAGGNIVGTTRLMRMNEAHRRLEIGGTFYATRAQRTGINTEAKRLLLGHAFDALGCGCVQIRTDALNRRSQAAIERIGATRDGVLRGHQTMADGRVRDTVVYSILAHEWRGVCMKLDYLMRRYDR